MKRVLIVYNTSRYVWLFRRPLIRRLKAQGYEVHVAAPPDQWSTRLVDEEGITYHQIGLDAKGMNPLRDLGAIIELFGLYRRVRPLAVLHYTIKPNIYGSMAARLAGVPSINNITGLGAAFSKDSAILGLVRPLYRIAFARVRRVFFQNRDDRELFLGLGMVTEAKAGLLPGSGVDTSYFAPRARSGAGGFTFLVVARLLEEKGIADFVTAARRVKEAHPEARFLLAGDHDPSDPHMVSREELEGWLGDGSVEWLGPVEEVREAYAAADCVVLPSRYREGVPRSLLEAASMGKPLIASDSVGCREPVEEGVNGFLCHPSDPENLAGKMELMLGLGAGRLEEMGRASREKMEREFEEKIVLDAYERELAALAASERNRE